MILNTYQQVTPGHVAHESEGINLQAQMREAQEQEATSTLTDGFNGARFLGIIVDGVIFGASVAYANKGAWVTAVNAQLSALGIDGTISENALTVTWTSSTNHVLGVHNPDTPDLDLTAWVAVQPAIFDEPLMGGCAVAAVGVGGASSPDSSTTISTFAGVVSAYSVPAKSVTDHYGLDEGQIPQGHSIRVVRRGTIALRVAPGEVVAALDPIFAGTLPGETPLFYPANDGGNTRLQIAGRFLVGGTAPSDGAFGLMALLT